MSTITLPNFRTTADVKMDTRLKDGGVYIDWSGLTNIKAWIYSDAQRALAGRCTVETDEDDTTVLTIRYAATKPQYLGVNRLIVQATYEGATKTYDKPVFNFVRWTDDQEDEEVTIDDPDIDVELEVTDVTSSILQEILDACIKATEEAQEVVDASRGPRGYSAYEIAVQDGFEGTEEEWLESLQGETGPQGPQGEQGETGPAGVTDVEVDVSPSSGTPAGTGSVYDGTLSLHFTGLKGQSAYEEAVENGFEGTEEEWLASLVGPQGQQGVQGIQGETGATPDISIGTVSTGAAGSAAAASITGTAAAPVLNLTIPQGIQGNTGSSVDYPYELVNNRTTNDATKGLSAAEGYRLGQDLSQLEAEVHNLSGKYYGLFESVNDLPEGDAVGYAFVGTQAPFAIYNFNGTAWVDSGASAQAIYGEPGADGVGLQTVTSMMDGTIVLSLTNGDTVTIDLNHNHPQYLKYVMLESESDMPATPDSTTLYMWPEE